MDTYSVEKDPKLVTVISNYKNDLATIPDINELYIKYFGKKGEFTLLLKEVSLMPLEEKKELGRLRNEYINTEAKNLFETEKLNRETRKSTDSRIDLTLLDKPKQSGYLHPTTQVINKLNEFFRYYGFSIAEGPDIETAENNFRKLNLPEGHPATDLQDTLFIQEPDILLRTHTSSVEARVLTDNKPPIRVVTPGHVFRNETLSATNSHYFYQYQGVVVDKGITIQNLKATIERLLKFLYGEETVIRFRYKYYPEVTPGLGTDIQCPFCKGKGCKTCKNRGWIEILGSGMIHYNTLKMCGIDPEEYTGFAFGLGLDRLVMAAHGLNDIRNLYWGGIVYKD